MDLIIIMENAPLDDFVVCETKLDYGFPNTQSNINEHEISTRRGRDKRALCRAVNRRLICFRKTNLLTSRKLLLWKQG